MKSKIKMILMGAAAMLAASCASDLNEEVQLTGKRIVLRAGIETPATRAAVDNGTVTWLKDDAISVRLSDGSNLRLTVTDASAGQSTATFHGTIVGNAELTIPTVGVYPAGSHTLTDGNITINMPAEYHVADNTNANMPMICEFDEKGEGAFSHMGGVMTFKMGMQNVSNTARKFVLTVADNQKITGDFTPVTEDGKQVIKATAGDGSNSRVTISFNHEQITGNVLIVNVPLPVGTYVGLKIDILDGNDKPLIETISTGATNTITRGKRINMPKLTPITLSAGTEVYIEGVVKVDETHYEFTSPAAFTWLAEQVNGQNNNFEGVTITLAEDITIPEGTEWTPIATGARSGGNATGNAFKGTFDGNDKTISGLTITSGTGDEAIGLFGIVDGGTVKNLNLTNVNITTSSQNAGAVAGLVVNGGTIENVKVSGTVSVAKGGGIVGRVLKDCTIKDCVNNATVTGSSTNVGGIAGCAYYTEEGKTMTIDNCTNNGVVTGKGYTGGIVGFSAAEVTNCKNTAAVKGVNSGGSVGGIVGEQQSAGKVCSCTNSGNVTTDGTSSNYGAGGIIGFLRYTGKTSDYPVKNVVEVCHNSNSGTILSGHTGAGGIVGMVFTFGNIHDNSNTAASITGYQYVTGVVGGYQDLSGSEYDSGMEGTEHHIYVTANYSSTKAAQITGTSTSPCTSLYVYDNTSGAKATVTGNWGADDSCVRVATTDELKSALENLDNASNSTIILAQGNYGYIDLMKGGAISNVKIIGEPGATVNGMRIHAEHLQSVTNLEVSGITFSGTETNAGSVYGLYVGGANGTENHVIKGVKITNCTFNVQSGTGITVCGSTAADYVHNVTVVNCTFNSSASDGSSALYLQSVDGLTVSGCTFTRSAYNAIQANTNVTGNVTITNNTFTSCGSRNIYLDGLKDSYTGTLTVTGNTFCLPTANDKPGTGPKEDGNYLKLNSKASTNLTANLATNNSNSPIDNTKAMSYYFAPFGE